MAMRTNRRQQLLREHQSQQGAQEVWSATANAAVAQHQGADIGGGGGGGGSNSSSSAAQSPPAATSSLPGDRSSWSRLENPTPYHLAAQQQRQQRPALPGIGNAAASATAQQSPLESPENSAGSERPLQHDVDSMDIDINDLLVDASAPFQYSSTVPNHHLPLNFGVANAGTNVGGGGGFGGVGGAAGGFAEAKPSTSAPASTHLFLTAGRLAIQPAQQQQPAAAVTPGSAESDSRCTSASASAAQPRDRTKKDSHNRIERKRRENINYQIGELGDIIPRVFFQDCDIKKNKGNILKASVEYIRELQCEQRKLQERLYQSDLRGRKLEELSRALAAQIQSMQQVMCSNGLQYQPSSIEESVVHGLLDFLADSAPAATAPAPVVIASVKAEPLAQPCQQPGSEEAADMADDCLALSDADPMFGCSDANSPLFGDQ